MLTAILLSVLFLLSYIAHHLFAGDTKFGDINHDGLLSDEEKQGRSNAGILFIAAPDAYPTGRDHTSFILFTAYRALTGEYDKHRKLTRITWPVWFYVAITGVMVYLMIRPYYY